MIKIIYLIFGHFLFDYPLQGDFIASGKNHRNPIPGIPFYWPLIAHCFLHGVTVGFILNNYYLGGCEFVSHIIADYVKCEGLTTLDQDQLFHILCKSAWLLIYYLLK